MIAEEMYNETIRRMVEVFNSDPQASPEDRLSSVWLMFLEDGWVPPQHFKYCLETLQYYADRRNYDPEGRPLQNPDASLRSVPMCDNGYKATQALLSLWDATREAKQYLSGELEAPLKNRFLRQLENLLEHGKTVIHGSKGRSHPMPYGTEALYHVIGYAIPVELLAEALEFLESSLPDYDTIIWRVRPEVAFYYERPALSGEICFETKLPFPEGATVLEHINKHDPACTLVKIYARFALLNNGKQVLTGLETKEGCPYPRFEAQKRAL